MKKQSDADKKAKILKQTAIRQQRHRAKKMASGYRRREFNLSDEENTAVIAFIYQLREVDLIIARIDTLIVSR